MFALEFRFPAGRYHATPWGRSVNEADLAWPPEPLRIARALVATWWRKGDREEFPDDLLARLIERLAEHRPVFRLPDAVHAHTRHYMPIGQIKNGLERTTLVFDAFARIDPSDCLIAAWPDLALSAEEFALAAHLAGRLSYLGRAESWVEARALNDLNRRDWNAFPADWQGDREQSARQTPAQLLAPLSADAYERARTRYRAANTDKPRSRARALFEATLPERLVNALTVETSDLQNAGWSAPPMAERILYQRPEIGPTPQHARPRQRHETRLPTVARFVMAGRPLPRIEDVVKLGDLMRLATLAQFGRDGDGRWRAPAVISGRDENGRPLKEGTHPHAFFLPEDADDDGRIDHLVVFAQGGFDTDSRRALDKVTRLWLGRRDRATFEDDDAPEEAGREEWRLALEGFGHPQHFADVSRLLGVGHEWISATPYLMPWHAKKRFGPAEQIAREVEQRGLGTLEGQPKLLASIEIHGRLRRPIHFHRFRSRRGLTQPDTSGSFWRLIFAEPVLGPLALGFGCHFGLGLFARAG